MNRLSPRYGGAGGGEIITLFIHFVSLCFMRYVIIGAGIAGTTAAEEIRKADPNAELTLIGKEPHPLYSRVLLPHYLKGKVPRERVFLKKWEWYDAQRITYEAGVEVLEIDMRHKFVATDDGREHAFDALLITAGTDARLFAEDKRGVSYLRTLDDADHLAELLREMRMRKEKQAAIYGGGFMALEYLNLFAQNHISTMMFLRGKGFWNSILTDEAQDFLLDYIRSKGVDVFTGISDFTLEGEKELTGVVANGAFHKASLLGIGIGSQFETAIFERAGIETGIGVKTNASLQTNIPNVYSAGDITEIEDTIVGRQLVYGNWMNAQMQGRMAGKNMTGEKQEMKLVSSYATHAFDLDIVFIGDTAKEFAHTIRTVLQSGDALAQVYERNGVTVGAVLMNAPKLRQPLTQAVQLQQYFD